MFKVKDILLAVGGLLAVSGSVWLGVAASARKPRRLRSSGGVAPGEATPDGAVPGEALTRELAAQLVEAAERAIGEIDRRADELRLLLSKAEERLATIRRETADGGGVPRPPEAERAAPVRSGPAALGGERERSLNDRFAVIYGLSDQGLGVDEIAARVKMTRGEVALIMGLRKAR